MIMLLYKPTMFCLEKNLEDDGFKYSESFHVKGLQECFAHKSQFD
jgi:hypothetical protein